MHPTTLPPVPVSVPSALSEDDLGVLRATLLGKAKGRDVDMLAFWQQLARLLAEGEEGRVALVHGGQIVSLWDTLGDAVQAGYDKYGVDGIFTTSPIRELELIRLHQFLAQQRSQPCPS